MKVKPFGKLLASVIMLVFCGIMMSGCSEKDLRIDTDVKPDITVKNGVFNITPQELIKELNSDLKAENLSLISEEYVTSTTDMSVNTGEGEELNEKNVTTYEAKITEKISLRLMSFESLNNGIPVVEIIYKSAESEKGDADELHKYFQVLSQNIAPQFNASEFTINRYANEDYDIDGLTYWCGYHVSGESEKILTYMITTNKEKFSFY